MREQRCHECTKEPIKNPLPKICNDEHLDPRFCQKDALSRLEGGGDNTGEGGSAPVPHAVERARGRRPLTEFED